MEADSYFAPGLFTTALILLILFSDSALAEPDSPKVSLPTAFNVTHRSLLPALAADIRAQVWSFRLRLWPSLHAASSTHSGFFWSMVTAVTILGAFPCFWFLKDRSRRRRPGRSSSQHSGKDVSDAIGLDAVSRDPGLLKKHSEYRSFTTSRFTYPSIRVFYRPHPQASKLPVKPSPLPLLVFIHGLGGSVAQFHPLLVSLVNVAPCLSIDLPGCGLSKFQPSYWDAYTTDSLVQLLGSVIEAYRDAGAGQKIILIGHSMGCSLAALLAAKTSPHYDLIGNSIAGLIAICPQATPPGPEDVSKFKIGLSIPTPIFDLWRRWDRRGGTESASVRRFVGAGAEEETKRLQVRFNEQSKTAVWRRMARGCLPDYTSGTAKGGIPGKEIWSGLAMPVFLAAGESDHVTPAQNLATITEFLGKVAVTDNNPRGAIPDSSAPVDIDGASKDQEKTQNSPRIQASISSSDGTLVSTMSMNDYGDSLKENSLKSVLKTTTLPAPAAHALLYAPSHSRTLAGLIQTFLADHIDKRLSLGWQLQYLTTEGKWDVKNLAKWKAVNPVSQPIAGVFRAMKTLREVDEVHCPKVFVKDWHGKIQSIVDISHESPVYDPQGLEAGGIHYHKFPTVSKLPPQVDEVKSFIALIDQLRSDISTSSGVELSDALIGVHCHYGFNRTGFFVVCYLVERLGYKLPDAIEEFRKCRPPGIRHEHFIDTLYVRYCIGLRRAPTL